MHGERLAAGGYGPAFSERPDCVLGYAAVPARAGGAATYRPKTYTKFSEVCGLTRVGTATAPLPRPLSRARGHKPPMRAG